jgi:UDP-N-acetylglucosamine 4,6-dehydratase/5-epimerase
VKQFVWDGSTILVTGGTGSFGRKFVEVVLRDHRPRKIIVFSRDELKQHEMRQLFPDGPGATMRYFLGDVRDPERLRRAFGGVDLVVHAAALKQVPACEYNPFEAVQTNIQGAKNIVDAAIDLGVSRVVALSTDKAVSPVNLYGATKLVAEKIFIQGNTYSAARETRFSCVRYGNVIGSRGSVIPLFQQQAGSGSITVTDERMTRFWITLEQGVRFVMSAAERMHGGEVFVPKLPSMRLIDLAAAIAPGCAVRTVGIRPGEKLHEVLMSEDEARQTLEFDDMYVIQPAFPWWNSERWSGGRTLPAEFRYASDTNKRWLTKPELLRMIEESAGAYARG